MSNTSHPNAVALPTDQELVLKVIPMPADCNANGDIFGGWVMAQVDLAGAVLPARYVRGRMATVAVNEFIFKQAVKVGDILSFFSRVVRVGNTSISVKVEVFAERFSRQGQYIKVTEATLTFPMTHSGSGRTYSSEEIKAHTELVLADRFARIVDVDTCLAGLPPSA